MYLPFGRKKKQQTNGMCQTDSYMVERLSELKCL